MKPSELAMVALLIAGGIVIGFVGYTYVGPMLSGTPASPAA
jgi:hypothetical protein